ncbi:hypothetical protein C8R45DRAFT_606042 [Mycena sanguinolenta]|nr:hypothetical protein C8R45DRAFT_606042 [Mycena sanguinolenta]
MSSTLFSLRPIVLEQKERIKGTSRADVERFIAESESKITRLDSQISALVELRDRERDCVAALRHLISPIHTLPVELLSEIFELAISAKYSSSDDDAWEVSSSEDNDSTVSESPSEDDGSAVSSSEADSRRSYIKDAFQVSHVCSDWRQIAHATPRLWTRAMMVDLRKLPSADEKRVYAEGLKTWLQRSAPLFVPRAIHLLLDDDSLGIPELLATAPLWRSLHLVTHFTPLSFVSEVVRVRLENLEELNLGPLERKIHFPTAVITTFTSFVAVPRLRKLRMCLFSNALPTLVPWAQLTHLKLYNILFPDSVLHDILFKCVDLIRIHLDTAGWFVPPIARKVIPLTHLRRLCLRFFEEGGYFMPFLDCLSAPVLEELRLNFVAAGPEHYPARFAVR